MKHLQLLILTLFCFSSSYAQVADTIKVGVKDTPPFIIEVNDSTYSGISINLWEEIAQGINVPFRYVKYDLAGLQQALEDGSIDITVNPLTVTSDRVKKYDFTQPFFITNLAIATTREGQNKWLNFVKNFFSVEFFKVIALLFVVLLVFGLLVWLFERKKNHDQFGKGIQGVWAGLWWSAVTMTTVGYGDKAPMTTGGRIVALVWMFTAIIIISGFTASIASTLTISELQTSIKGPNDLKNYTVATVSASTGEKYLQRAHIPFQTATDINEALQMLSNKEVDAVVYDEPLLRYTVENNFVDDLMVLEPTFATQYYSFALPDKSELLKRVNPVLLTEINSPLWRSILDRYNLGKD